ncbi:MAG: hypothetical protein QOE36_2943 [Gaiellaceae bacterium]|nr:hypothetical protein [Gaiellaceae bacterium]
MLVGTALALAACGSKPLSPLEFRARASSICIAERLRSKQVQRPLAPADVTNFVAAALRILKPAVDKLGALRAPDELRPRFETALALLRRRLGLLQEAEKRLRDRAEPLGTFAALTPKLRPLRTEERGQWVAIGLPQCGSP